MRYLCLKDSILFSLSVSQKRNTMTAERLQSYRSAFQKCMFGFVIVYNWLHAVAESKILVATLKKWSSMLSNSRTFAHLRTRIKRASVTSWLKSLKRGAKIHKWQYRYNSYILEFGTSQAWSTWLSWSIMPSVIGFRTWLMWKNFTFNITVSIHLAKKPATLVAVMIMIYGYLFQRISRNQ